MNDFKKIEGLKERRELPVINHVRILLLAGGKGSRLGPSDTAKPLREISIDGFMFPMIDYSINLIPSNFRQITVVTSTDPMARSQDVTNHIANTENKIDVYEETVAGGTAGAVANFIENKKPTEDIIVVSPTDTLFPFQIMNELIANFEKSGKGLSWIVTSVPGDNAQNTGKIIVNGDEIVESREGINEGVGVQGGMTSVGVVVLNREYFINKYREYKETHTDQNKVDLYRQFIPWLIEQGESVGYFDIKQPAPDLGTPDRLASFVNN